MKLHNLKIISEYWDQVWLGNKTFELRQDDRDYEVGDLIHFVDVDGKELVDGVGNLYKITYILRNVPQYGLPYGYAILSIQPVKLVEKP